MLYRFSQKNSDFFREDIKLPQIAVTTVTEKNITETSIPKAKLIYKIDINKADYNDFLQLGISENLATACIELRGKISYFSNTLELLYADGMTKEIYNKIEPYVYIPPNG